MSAAIEPLANSYDELLQRVANIKPRSYARNRNFLKSDVTQLSPYITHGIIGVHHLAEAALAENTASQVEKFIFQLAWREYFHRIWQDQGNNIFGDMRHSQSTTVSDQLPVNLLTHNTGIAVIDQAVADLYRTGYMHNHARMWVASLAANIGQSSWRSGARWMHYHLLDGDLASNTLSWQWIAGTFSNKRYLANQQNLNKYSQTEQHGTFIDTGYAELATMQVPVELGKRDALTLCNQFPQSTLTAPVDAEKKLLLYHPFNLDPHWRSQEAENVRRVLLIEPDSYEQFPLSPARWQFVEHWARQIAGLEIYVGSIDSLLSKADKKQPEIISREYPLTRHWPGQHDARDWIFPEVSGYFQSFFKFWNVAKKQLPLQHRGSQKESE